VGEKPKWNNIYQMSQEIRDAMSLYAQCIVNKNPFDNRKELHRKLCDLLGFPYEQFKPFGESDIKEDLWYNKAMDILDQKIGEFTIQKQEEPHLHCGCCQVLIKDGEEWKIHSKTKEHLQNAIRTWDKILDDPHHSRAMKEDIARAKVGKQVDFDIVGVYMQSKFRAQLELFECELKELEQKLGERS
jgi:hypothetical protein